jgi:hypothetical protein
VEAELVGGSAIDGILFAMAYAVRTQKDYDQLTKSKRNAAKTR